MKTPYSRTLLNIIKKSGFYKTDRLGEVVSKDIAYACVISQDFLKEMAGWMVSVGSLADANAALLDIANNHTTPASSGSPHGGVFWELTKPASGGSLGEGQDAGSIADGGYCA